MLITQASASRTPERQGSRGASLGELRRRLADPSSLSDGHRQRLLELCRRAARVRALGGAYAEVELSRWAEAAAGQPPEDA